MRIRFYQLPVPNGASIQRWTDGDYVTHDIMLDADGKELGRIDYNPPRPIAEFLELEKGDSK
jgi:hypothetical protein